MFLFKAVVTILLHTHTCCFIQLSNWWDSACLVRGQPKRTATTQPQIILLFHCRTPHFSYCS